MAMDNVRAELHGLASLKDRFAEKDKTLAVVRIVPLGTPVEPRAPKIAVMIDEIDGNSLGGFGRADSRRLQSSPAHGNLDPFASFLDAEFLTPDGLIFRQDNA